MSSVNEGTDALRRLQASGLLKRFEPRGRQLGARGLLFAAMCLSFWACGKPAGTTQEPSSQSSSASPSSPSVPAGERPSKAPSAVASGPTDEAPARPFRFPEPKRLIAIGDVHGDYEVTLHLLRSIGAIDATGRWSGGELTVVQTGDQTDRGDGEREILDLFDRLRREAAAAGGAFHALLGNHETMNAVGDFRYVTPKGFRQFDDVQEGGMPEAVLARFPKMAQGRARAFLPGGIYAAMMAERNMIVVVGDSVFVHGGLLPKYAAEGVGRLNNQVSDWLKGRRSTPPPAVLSEDGPLWARNYSVPSPSPADCAQLQQVLGTLGAKRMVVGHTVQESGITHACDKQVWRIDVGLAKYYGQRVEALQISEAGVEPVRFPPPEKK